MKERQILFSAPMVRALLAGAKTQTRRVVKPQPKTFDYAVIPPRPVGDALQTIRCPYGQPGDRLWVREAWAESDMSDGTPVIAYRAGGCVVIGRKEQHGPDHLIHDYAFDETPEVDRWRPSIHMPRWAARITLEIVAVRVELLNGISEDDAIAEGAECEAVEIPDRPGRSTQSYMAGYKTLWELINGPSSWDANPWVWVVEFRRV